MSSVCHLMWPSWLRSSVAVARGEWVRKRRERGGLARRWRLLAIVAVVGVLGRGAYGTGRAVAAGEAVPPGVIGVAASAATAWIAWRSSRLAAHRFEAMNPDLLLAALPVKAPALGLLLFVSARVGAVLAAPTVAVAVGAAVGLGAPAVAFTVVVAVAAASAVAVGAGVSTRLAARLLSTRLARGRTYRDLLVLFGWMPLLVGWFLLGEIPEDTVPARLAAAPTGGVADLALLGAAGPTGADPAHGLAALAALAAVSTLFAGMTIDLARRIWERDPAEAAPGGSRSLLEPGRVERFTGAVLPRPVRTVARKRWLMERRVPRGLLSTAYVLFFVGIVLFPAFAIAGVPGFVWVVFAVGLAVGVAFGFDPIGVEYRGLAMVLTTARGREFVGGLLLAALVPAAVVVPAVVLPLGAASAATPAETLSFVLFGVATCGCTVALALAAGLGVDRSAFVPLPAFFTDVPWYGETGWTQFRRLGTVLLAATVAAGPAFVGTHPAAYERAAAIGIPVPATRSGALLAGALSAAAVARIAFEVAVKRYEEYRFE